MLSKKICLYITVILPQLFNSKTMIASLIPESCECNTIVVCSNQDSEESGTLRHAIKLLNQSKFTATPVIYFVLPKTQKHIIRLKTKLPTIQKPVIVDGRTLSLTGPNLTAIVGDEQTVAAITVDESCAEQCSFSNIAFHNVEFPSQATGIYAANKRGTLVQGKSIHIINCQEKYGPISLSAYEEETKSSCCCLLTRGK